MSQNENDNDSSNKSPPLFAGRGTLVKALLIGIVGWAGFFVFVGLLAWVARHMWNAL